MRKATLKPKLLVTGGSSTVCFNIVRCLREVFADSWIGVFDSLPFGPCFHSSLIDERWLLPQIDVDPESYGKLLLDISKRSGINTILSGTDHDTLILAYLKNVLDEWGIKILVPNEHAVSIVNSKTLSSRFADEHSIDQPLYVIAETDDEAEDFAKKIQPSIAVIKEISTINAFAPTPIAARELARWFRQCFGSSPLIQEFIPGLAISITTVVMPSGEILEPIAMQKMATDGHGETLEGIVVEAQEIKEKSQHILRLLKWIGPVEVEWIVDARDKVPKLLEINSRFPAWIYLTHWQGRNLPAYCIEYLCGSEVFPPEPPPPGWTFCRQPMDIMARMEPL